jgi:MFS family permease
MAGAAASGIPAPAKRRGYSLMAGVLLVMLLGGTLPVPLYVLYERQMGFGPLGVTVVFAAYVAGTLLALIALGYLSDHIGRWKALAAAAVCTAVSTGLSLAASGIGVLIAARLVSGIAAGLATGTATTALSEFQPREDRRAAAVVASGSNMTGLGLGPLGFSPSTSRCLPTAFSGPTSAPARSRRKASGSNLVRPCLQACHRSGARARPARAGAPGGAWLDLIDPGASDLWSGW